MSIKNNFREKHDHKIMDMELGHLIEDAEIWWDKIGSEILKKRQFSDENKTQQDCLDATNPVHPNYIGGKSGILLGLPWVMLLPEDRIKIGIAYTISQKNKSHG